MNHDCLGKSCQKFEKIDDATYWRSLTDKQHHKEKIKSAKARLHKFEDFLQEVKDICQAYIDDIGYEMHIIRIENTNSNSFTLFYVSEYPFADGDRFPEFIDALKQSFPKWKIHLQHIKDMSGHFVTCDEYCSLKR